MMTYFVVFLLGGIAVLWTLLMLAILAETPINKHTQQHNLEPWQVADQWHDHILGEKQ